DDMNAELEAVLGDDWRALPSSLMGFPLGADPVANFPAEKRAQLREITKQYRSELEELNQKAMTGQMDKEEAAKYRELQRQKNAAIAGVLSPQEMEEYLYRNSPAADYVKRVMPEAKSEAEYRTMVKLARAMEMVEW